MIKMEVTNETKSIFLEVMGDYPINRILDFLIVFNKFDYCKKDIAKKSHVSYATLKYIWSELEKNNLVQMTRQIGKAKMYTLNHKNAIVMQIKKTYWLITKSTLKEEILVRSQ